jgi:hypothetical protein
VGWRSQAAIQRVKEALSEIGKVRRNDGVLAEGAVWFLERISRTSSIQNKQHINRLIGKYPAN